LLEVPAYDAADEVRGEVAVVRDLDRTLGCPERLQLAGERFDGCRSWVDTDMVCERTEVDQIPPSIPGGQSVGDALDSIRRLLADGGA
jgi:hypothetical protein